MKVRKALVLGAPQLGDCFGVCGFPTHRLRATPSTGVASKSSTSSQTAKALSASLTAAERPTSPQGMVAQARRASAGSSSIAAIAGLAHGIERQCPTATVTKIKIKKQTSIAKNDMSGARLVSRPHVVELQRHSLSHWKLLAIQNDALLELNPKSSALNGFFQKNCPSIMYYQYCPTIGWIAIENLQRLFEMVMPSISLDRP